MIKLDPKTRNLVIRTNKLLHQRDAHLYDKRHFYTRDKQIIARLREDIQIIKRELDVDIPIFLDLGAGTGFLGRYFLEARFRVIGIDISENMLRQFKESMNSDHLGLVVAEIDSFLEMTRLNKFHVIGLSSTLHHLPDYIFTLCKCCDLLHPGGFLYILNEPCHKTSGNYVANILDKMDEILEGLYFKAVYDPSDLVSALVRRLTIFLKLRLKKRNTNNSNELAAEDCFSKLVNKIQFRFQKGENSEFIDDTIAEIHADPGLDLGKIDNLLHSRRFHKVSDSFYSSRRFFIFRWLGQKFLGGKHVRLIFQKEPIIKNAWETK